MMTSPSARNATSSSISACVPIAIGAPAATASRAASRARRLPLPASQTGSMPSGASHALNVRKCCSARISVGAISATWCPDSIAASAASAATTVFPEPTSPCTRRSIGAAFARSRFDLRDHALLCARQRIRQLLAQCLAQPRIAFQRRRAMAAQLLAQALQAQVLRKQFLERESLLRRMRAHREQRDVGVGRRTMHGQKRFAQRAEIERRAQGSRGISSSRSSSGRRSSARAITPARRFWPRPSVVG